MRSLPVRFVVRFTALPGRGDWEAALHADGPHGSGEPRAWATGATPEAALAALMPSVGQPREAAPTRAVPA